MGQNELNLLVTKSQIFNRKEDITGFLCKSDNLFVQYIEGPQKAIDKLFVSIRLDFRHKDIVFKEANISVRKCENWSMNLLSDYLHGSVTFSHLIRNVLLDGHKLGDSDQLLNKLVLKQIGFINAVKKTN